MSDSERLRKMLAGAKAVMDVVETGNYTTGNVNPDILLNSPEVVNENVGAGNLPPVKNQYGSNAPTYRNLETTKMPKEIVRAMIENPINNPGTPYHTFELNEDLLNEINPSALKQRPQQQQQTVVRQERTTDPIKRLAETKRTALNGLSEEDIREIVRDEMEEIIYEYFDKRVIKEDIQIKVGSTIFSGKLSPLPSKKSAKKR